MRKLAGKNVAASVHQRLLNVARETSRPFNEVLQYFAMEHLLYRLSCSDHRDSFVLKGALLFRVWDVPDSRATRDIDFLAFLDNSPENLAKAGVSGPESFHDVLDQIEKFLGSLFERINHLE